MNRIDKLFSEKKKNILSIYFTAGFPNLNDTISILESLDKVGIDRVILPDLPIEIYLKEYKSIFEKYNLKNIFLITPQTSEKRIRFIDENSNGFIYMVSSASTTGVKNGIDVDKENYFERI